MTFVQKNSTFAHVFYLEYGSYYTLLPNVLTFLLSFHNHFNSLKVIYYIRVSNNNDIKNNKISQTNIKPCLEKI